MWNSILNWKNNMSCDISSQEIRGYLAIQKILCYNCILFKCIVLLTKLNYNMFWCWNIYRNQKACFLQLLFTPLEKLKQEFYTFWIHTCKVIRSITCFSLYPSFICGSGIWQHVFVLQSSYHYYAYLNTFIFLFGYKWFLLFLLSPLFIYGYCFS